MAATSPRTSAPAPEPPPWPDELRLMPVLRSAGSILFLTGPRTSIRRNLERLPRRRVALTVPRLLALLHPPRIARTRWLPLPLRSTPPR